MQPENRFIKSKLMNEIILPYATIRCIDPIVYCRYNKDVELGFPEIKELYSCIESIVGKKSCLIFYDVFLIGNLTNEGKRILKNYSNSVFCKGTAILIDKDRYECVQNLVNSYHLTYPFRIFNSGQDAIDWLYTLSID